MAKITGPIKTWRLHRRTDKKQRRLEEWQAYREKAGKGKDIMPLARWTKAGKPSGAKPLTRKVSPTQKKKKIAYYGQGRETADTLLRRIKRGK